MKKIRLLTVAIVMMILVVTATGCIRPYDTPTFIEIKPNETAFLVPLEGKTSEQASFDSEKFLQESKIASKRIQISHKWVQTGRWDYKGVYQDTVRVIVVDRTPETREWLDGQGIKVRSKDGIGFMVGVSATGSIAEEDASRFLYKTSGSRTLATVMDMEVRNRLETKLIEEFARNDMTFINTNKGTIMTTVSTDVVTYFKGERGITLSNVGYKGDIVFDDPKVQDALNAKFTALQEQDAETIRRVTATNTSLAQIEVEKNNALALAEEAKGIADYNREIQASLSEGVIQKQWIEKWDGKLPTYSGDSMDFMINLQK